SVWHSWSVWLWLVSNDCLSGEEQCSNRGSILQCRAGDLNWVVDASFHQVNVLTGLSVQALTVRQRCNLISNNAWLETSVESNLLQRSGQCRANDVRTGCLITGQLEGIQSSSCLQQRYATASNDALFNSSLCVTNCVLNAVLALIELSLSCSTNLNDFADAVEHINAIVKLHTVFTAIGVVDLSADLLDAAVDVLLTASTLNVSGFRLGDNNVARLTQQC